MIKDIICFNEKGVKIVPLSAFFHCKGDEEENVWVLNYSCEKEEALRKGVEILSNLV